MPLFRLNSSVASNYLKHRSLSSLVHRAYKAFSWPNPYLSLQKNPSTPSIHCWIFKALGLSTANTTTLFLVSVPSIMLIDPSAISSLLGLAVWSFQIHNLKEIFLNPLCQISYSLLLCVPGQQRHFYLKQITLYYTVFRCFPLLPLSPVKYKLRLFLFTLRHLQLINVTLTNADLK